MTAEEAKKYIQLNKSVLLQRASEESDICLRQNFNIALDVLFRAFDTATKALDDIEHYKTAIDKIKEEILSLKGDNFPNGYYVKIIDKHIKEVES